RKECVGHVEKRKKEELLQRCLGAYTQNSNESYNAVLWRLAPKHLHCGLSSLEIATYMATCFFNEGFTSLLKVMSAISIRVGDEAHRFASIRDEERVKRADRSSAFGY
ncbi:hypothetical protein X777_12499, partial [Ooceraea biroi]